MGEKGTVEIMRQRAVQQT